MSHLVAAQMVQLKAQDLNSPPSVLGGAEYGELLHKHAHSLCSSMSSKEVAFAHELAIQIKCLNTFCVIANV